MTPERIKELEKALNDENISYGELQELDAAAAALGIEDISEKMAVDILIEVQERSEKVERLRHNAPGYIWGVELTQYATDAEILEIADLKDRLAKLHNAAFDRKKRGDRQDAVKPKA